jgi:hypothetical protein
MVQIACCAKSFVVAICDLTLIAYQIQAIVRLIVFAETMRTAQYYPYFLFGCQIDYFLCLLFEQIPVVIIKVGEICAHVAA